MVMDTTTKSMYKNFLATNIALYLLTKAHHQALVLCNPMLSQTCQYTMATETVMVTARISMPTPTTAQQQQGQGQHTRDVPCGGGGGGNVGGGGERDSSGRGGVMAAAAAEEADDWPDGCSYAV
jgi:hypothetical protein